MEFSQEDFDRLLLFEHARKTAESNYAQNPLDADVSISLSLSLLISMFHSSILTSIIFNYVYLCLCLYIMLSF